MGGGGSAAMMHVMLPFEGRVGAKTFDCNSDYTGLGTAATDVRISDFRLYVHDVRLHRAGGDDVPVDLMQDGLWQYKNLALLDFEDKSGHCANGTGPTNTMVHGMVPEGDYDGIAFKLGVPFDLNHADVATAPSPLNLSGLFWSWNGGYKFLRADSVPVAGGGAFNIHLGSTGCMGDPPNSSVTSCARPNVVDIHLTGFDPTKNKVVIDYAALVEASDLSQDKGGAPGCMSGQMDPECAPIFERLGIDITDGSMHPETQKFFHVE